MSCLFKIRAGFFKPELALKLHEPSQAERPLAQAKSELSRAELGCITTIYDQNFMLET